MNQLIKDDEKNQYFFYETKADILYSHGYTNESKKFYEKVSLKYSNNHYINRRIFDIKFNSKSEYKLDYFKSLILDFSFLLLIFPEDKILEDKIEKISLRIKNNNWFKYFQIKRIILNKTYKSH